MVGILIAYNFLMLNNAISHTTIATMLNLQLAVLGVPSTVLPAPRLPVSYPRTDITGDEVVTLPG